MGVVLPFDPAVGLLVPGGPQTRNPRYFAVPQGLVTLWGFDPDCIDTANNAAPDLSPAGNNGTLSGTVKPALIQGQIGTALTFNSNYVLGSAVINLPRASIETWFRIASAPATTGLVSGCINTAAGGNDKNLLVRTDGKLYFYIYDGAEKATGTPSATVPLNQWVHGVGTCDGTTARCYMNGIQIGSVAAGDSYAAYTAPNFVASGDCPAGASAPNRGRFMAIDIDQQRLYNRAIDPWEVLQLYQAGLAGRRDAGAWLPGECEMPALYFQAPPTPGGEGATFRSPLRNMGGMMQ